MLGCSGTACTVSVNEISMKEKERDVTKEGRTANGCGVLGATPLSVLAAMSGCDKSYFYGIKKSQEVSAKIDHS